MAAENGKGLGGREEQSRSLPKRAVDRLRRLLGVQDLAADAGEAYRPGQQASAPAAGAATAAQDLDDLKVGSGAVTATAASVRSVALHTDNAPEEEPLKGLGGAASGGAAVASGGGTDGASGAAIPAGEAGGRPAASLSGGGGPHGGGDSAPLPPLSSSGSTAGLATEDGQLIATGQVVAQGGWNAHVLPGTFQGKYGLLVVDPSGHWTYHLDNGDPAVQHLNNGQQVEDHFQCMVVDGTGKQLPVPIVVGVRGTDDAAVISGAKTGSVTEDLGPQQASGQLTATDIDNGDQPSFVPQTVQGTYGTFDLGADGHWSYTADPQKIQGLKAGEQVVDSFPVATINAQGESVSATVSVSVVGTDDKPVFPPLSLTAKEDGGEVVGRLVATDVDAQSLSYAPVPGALPIPGVSIAADGTVRVDPSQPEFQSLGAGEHRDLQVPVQVTDERGVTVQSLVTVRIDGTNDAPVVTVRPPVPVDEGSGVHSVQVLATDVDTSDKLTYGLSPGVPLPAGVSLDPATGQVSIDANNPAYQHLGVGDVQTVMVPVVVSDGHGGSTSTQVGFELHGTNDAPVLAAIGQQTATEGGAPINGQLSGTDPDSTDTLTYGLAPGINAPAGFMIDPNGHWAFDPTDPAYDHLRAGEQQQVVVPLQVSDGHGGVSQQTMTVTVTGTNDGAVIGGTSTGSVQEDGKQTVSGVLTVQDPDQTEQHFQAADLVGSYGTMHLGADGLWTYTLNNSDPKVQALGAGSSATDTFTVRSADGTTHQVSVQVDGTNDATVISGVRSGAITEDLGPQQVSGVLSASDVDAGQTPSFVPQTVQGTYGTFDLGADGHWSYTADPQKIQGLKAGEQVVDSFPVATINAQGESVSATVSVSVVGTDDKPVFPPLSLTAKEDGGEVVGRLVATDVDAQSLSYAPVPGALPIPGVSIAADGTVRVDPSQPEFQSLGAGEHRDLQVPVQVTDERGVTVQSLVTVRIDGTNDAPVVTVRPPVPVDEGSGVHSVQVLATDVDTSDKLTYGLSPGVPLPAGVSLDPATGQVSIDANNPAYQHLGVGDVQTVMVPVVVSDGHGGSTNTQVGFELHGTNDAPVLAAIGQSTATEGGAPINGQLSATDPDSTDTLTYGLAPGINAPAGFTIDPNGHWAFDPQDPAYDHLRAGEQQQVVVPLQVSDGHGGVSQQTMTVTVTGTNDGAVIGGTSTGSVQEDGKQTVSGVLTVQDPDQGEAAFRPEDHLSRFGVLHLAADGSWTYTLTHNDDPLVQGLKPGTYITEYITVHAVDGTAHQVAIEIHGTEDKAVISGTTSGVVKEDVTGTASGQLQVSDRDQGDNPVFHAETLQGVYGQLVIDASGHWTYQLDNAAAQVLQDGTKARETFTVLASDAQGHQVSQTVLVDVQGTADAAVISGTATGSVSEDQVLQASGRLTVIDPDRNEAHFNSGDQIGTYGTLHMGADGTWSYQLNNASPLVQQLTGRDQVSERFIVTSADGTTHQITIQVAGRNDVAQISGSSSGQVTEDAQQLAAGRLNVSDADRGEAHFDSGDQVGSYGTLHMDADGAWTYRLNNSDPKVQALGAGSSATDTFTVRSADGTTHQVSVRVAGSNDAAVISGTSTGQLQEDGQLTASGQLQFRDVDQGEASLNPSDVGDKVGTYGTLHINADGSWIYQLNNSARAVQDLQAGDVRQDSFTVHSVDGTTHVLQMNVQGSSDAPVLSAGQISGAKEDTSFTLTRDQILTALHASDPDGDPLNVSSISYGGSDATLVDNHNGTWTVTPHANWSGDLNLQVTVSDGQNTSTGTLTVPVAAVADQVSLTVAPSLTSTFEDPSLGGQAFHFADPTQWGWQTDNISGKVEQGKGQTYGDPNDKNTGLIELEGNANEKDNLYRVLDTQPGAMYHFSLDVSGRVGTRNADDAAVEVLWEGKVIDTIRPDVNTFHLVNHQYDLTAHTEHPRIEFRALTHDGSGPIVDNPTFEFKGFRGTEDTPLSIKLSVETPDKDGSENLSTAIKGLPVGFVITDGTSGHRISSSGETQTIDMQGWDPQHLQVIPPPNFHGQVNAVLIATSTETSNHDQSSTQIPVPLIFDGVNDPPTVHVSAGSTLSEGSAVLSSSQISGSDVDGDTTSIDTAWLSGHGWSSGDGGLTYSKAGTYGSATLTTATGSISYQINNTPDSATDHLADGQNVRDTFDVQVNDGHGGAVIGSAVFNVTGTNDAPTVTAGVTTALTEGSTQTATSILTIRDPDTTDSAPTIDTAWLSSNGWTTGDGGRTYSKAGTYGSATVNLATSTVSYELNNSPGGATDQLKDGQRVHDDFSVQVRDSHGATALATPSFGVIGANDAPTVLANTPPMHSASEGKDGVVTPVDYTEQQLLHLIGAADVDGDPLHITAISVPAGFGSFSKLANGDWRYTPPQDQHDAGLSVSITVADQHNQSTTAHALINLASSTDSAKASLGVTSEASVMHFSAAGQHAFKETGAGALGAFTLEVMAVGDPNNKGSATGSSGQVLFNLSEPNNNNVLSLWRPAALSIAFGGSDHDTQPPLDLTTGQHRLTLTWDKDSGRLTLYDNGKEYQHWDNINQGHDLPAGTIVTVGQKMGTPGSKSGFNDNEQFHGDLFNVTMTDQKVGPTDVQVPLANHIGSGHLLLDLREAHGTIVDTAGASSAHALTVTNVGTVNQQVDTRVSAPQAGALLNLALTITKPSDPDDHISRELLRGLPRGTVLADGSTGHTFTVGDQPVDLLNDLNGWNLAHLQAQLAASTNQTNFPLQLVVETTGPDGATSRAVSDASVLFDPTAPLHPLADLPAPAAGGAPAPPPPPPPDQADAVDDHGSTADGSSQQHDTAVAHVDPMALQDAAHAMASAVSAPEPNAPDHPDTAPDTPLVNAAADAVQPAQAPAELDADQLAQAAQQLATSGNASPDATNGSSAPPPTAEPIPLAVQPDGSPMAPPDADLADAPLPPDPQQEQNQDLLANL